MAALGASRKIALSAGMVGGLLLLAALGTAALSYEAADRLVHPPREHMAVTPADRGLDHEDTSFLTRDGVRLSAWWIPAEGQARGTVIFLHGYGASKSQSLSVAPFLHRAGFHVLAFDFRAHGDSEGGHTTIGVDEGADVRAAIDHLAARGDVDMDRVAVFGWSMGAATALNAARDLPEVRAFIADSSFASMRNIVANNLASLTGLPTFPFGTLIVTFASAMTGHGIGDNEPAREARDLHRPLLVIQGMRDRLARPDDDGKALASAAGEGAELWLVPDAGHVDARRAEPREYETRVVAFLTTHLL